MICMTMAMATCMEFHKLYLIIARKILMLCFQKKYKN